MRPRPVHLPALTPLLLAVLLMPGCATKRPVLYPNAWYQHVGQVAAEEDVEECFDVAAGHGLEAEPEKRAAEYTVLGGAFGGAVGAARGAVWNGGHAGRRAAAGAAGGATAGFLLGLVRWRDPDPIQRAFVQRCLGEQGYAIIGWR